MLNLFLEKHEKTHHFLFQRLNDIFHQHEFHDMNRETSKLRTYKILKTKIGYESYLSDIENVNHRIALTKFRLSNHNLKIESGRHQGIGKNKRFCPFCPNHIEDEQHSLLQCKAFSMLRTQLFEYINARTNEFINLRNSQKFTFLLTNSKYIAKTAQFLYKMFHCREFLMANHRNIT